MMHFIQDKWSLVPPIFYGPIAFLAWVFMGWLIKRMVIYRLRQWARRTKAQWDDVLVEAISFPINFILLASGLVLLERLLPLPQKVDQIFEIILQGSIVLAVILFIDRIFIVLINQYSHRTFFSKVSSGLVKGFTRGFILSIGLLVFLDLLGISITPILASLGIGSLAVALALQDSLSNFFAGIYVAIDRPVNVGDFIRIESGQEGHVQDVGWRNTRLITAQNNVVIIPNSKLISTVVTNFYLPNEEVQVTLTLGVHYKSNLRLVELVTVNCAKEVLAHFEGAVKTFEPVVHFVAFGESGIDLNLTVRVKNNKDVAPIKSELIKKIHTTYSKEGILIPYPTRTFVKEEAINA